MKAWMWGIVIALIFGSGYWIGTSNQNKDWTIKYQKREKELEDAALVEARKTMAAEAKIRELSDQRVIKLADVDKDAHNQITSLSVSVAAADDLNRRLRSELDRLKRTDRSKASTNSTVTPISKAASDPLDLFSELYYASQQADRAVSEEADRRRIAGISCEAAYDALSTTQ